MQKILMLTLVCFLVFSCGEGADTKDTQDDNTSFFSLQALPNLVATNERATQLLDAWSDYKEFENSYGIMMRASNREELQLAVDDLLEKQKTWAQGTYPPEFDKAQIRSRQRVLLTQMLRLKGGLNDRAEIEDPMKALVTAYNALRSQFNVQVNNSLDINQYLDEN
ncbi:hypothetical protein ABV409_02695 [Flagellimonas sp. DF-77]|uniref:hypothetical protein n=1 Tax=Flagellimonas algarum TaxID=3230298 RepID=UPI003399F03C